VPRGGGETAPARLGAPPAHFSTCRSGLAASRHGGDVVSFPGPGKQIHWALTAFKKPDRKKLVSFGTTSGFGNVFRKDGDLMNVVVMIVALAALVAQGGSTAGVHVWKSSDIAAKGKALAQKLDANKVASEVVESEGNRTFMIAHREGSGQAEWHEKQADVIMISSGEITMVYGGTIVDGKTTGAGEMRGPSIRGGTEVKLGPGDVLTIPAKVPHQMKLDSGKQVTYFVTKVVE
jgi:mannose-6-phosphate isomerase-like protein (cupin superfamily)